MVWPRYKSGHMSESDGMSEAEDPGFESRPPLVESAGMSEAEDPRFESRQS